MKIKYVNELSYAHEDEVVLEISNTPAGQSVMLGTTENPTSWGLDSTTCGELVRMHKEIQKLIEELDNHAKRPVEVMAIGRILAFTPAEREKIIGESTAADLVYLRREGLI
jgi:hypothetical protein